MTAPQLLTSDCSWIRELGRILIEKYSEHLNKLYIAEHNTKGKFFNHRVRLDTRCLAHYTLERYPSLLWVITDPFVTEHLFFETFEDVINWINEEILMPDIQVLPTDALIVVDVQNDFCEDGSLAVTDGDHVVPMINQIAPHFKTIVFTRDWHPENHFSFSAEPQYRDGSWPKHCVAGTEGAEFHPDLYIPDDAMIIDKATDPNVEAYSGFQGTNLAEKLKKKFVKTVFIVGLATDYCVKETALDAVKNGFETWVLTNAVRAVNVPPDSGQKAINEMITAGVRVVDWY